MAHSNPDPFFKPQYLPEPRIETVVWLDIMGTSAIMDWSEKVQSINIFKLIKCVVETQKPESMEVYPMMDGIYMTHDDEGKISEAFIEIFTRFAEVLLDRYEEYEVTGDMHDSYLAFSPILRGGAARGEVYHGKDITQGDLDGELVDNLVMGKPVTWAHKMEREAPPFGFKLHSSVDDEDLSGEVVEWWSNREQGEKVKSAIIEYFNYHGSHPQFWDKSEPHSKHIEQAREFFPGSMPNL